MGPATFTLGLTGRIKVHRVSCWDTRSPGHWCKGGSRCCSTWGRLRVPLVGCSDFTQVSLGGVNVDQQLDQLWEVPRDRRLCGKGVKEFLVEPEQQAVDLGLVTIVAVGHITLEFGVIGVGKIAKYSSHDDSHHNSNKYKIAIFSN